MPYFLIDFNGGRNPYMTYNFLDNSFLTKCNFIPNIETLHFISQKDFFVFSSPRNTVLFETENPVVVEHEDGHRPVKILTKERLEIVANFLIR